MHTSTFFSILERDGKFCDNFVSVWELEILFPNITKGINDKSSCGYTVFPQTYQLLQYGTNHTSHPMSCFAWICPICNNIFPIIDQCKYFLPLWQVPDSQKLFDFEQNKCLYLIEKRVWVLQFLKFGPKILLVL